MLIESVLPAATVAVWLPVSHVDAPAAIVQVNAGAPLTSRSTVSDDPADTGPLLI
jgi:hypothetical protein